MTSEGLAERKAAEDVARAAAEQQEAAERQRVPVQHPGQAGGGEVQGVLDVRQRDVHDGGVEDDHELGAEHDGERDAGTGTRSPFAGAANIDSPIRQARGTMRKDTEVRSGYYTEAASVWQTE